MNLHTSLAPWKSRPIGRADQGATSFFEFTLKSLPLWKSSPQDALTGRCTAKNNPRQTKTLWKSGPLGPLTESNLASELYLYNIGAAL
ncbi:hypothetical protein D3C71_1639780 [compost metagenome]